MLLNIEAKYFIREFLKHKLRDRRKFPEYFNGPVDKAVV